MLQTIDMNTLENCARIVAEAIARMDGSWEDKLCWND